MSFRRARRPSVDQWRAAWRTVGGQRFYARSRWEANYARFLEYLSEHGAITRWEHEPKTFWFQGIRRGTCSYLPDFRVTLASGAHEWHEVKGWMDAKSATKLRRMAKYHPAEVVLVFDREWFQKHAGRLLRVIPGWETAVPGGKRVAGPGAHDAQVVGIHARRLEDAANPRAVVSVRPVAGERQTELFQA